MSINDYEKQILSYETYFHPSVYPSFTFHLHSFKFLEMPPQEIVAKFVPCRTSRNTSWAGTIEELIGIDPKESVEQMIGVDEPSQPTSPYCPAVFPHWPGQERDPGTVNFTRPEEPSWIPLPPPDNRDSLQTIANKMEALSIVVKYGDGLMVATEGRMLSGWNVEIAMGNLDTEQILTHQELGELRTIKKLLNIATTRENEVRAELNKLVKGISASLKILEGRSRDKESKMQAQERQGTTGQPRVLH
jgi:hypothetical protein